MSREPARTDTAALPKLGRYQLLAKLGQGGMGEVYLAHDTQLDRQVAVKLLPQGSVNDADAVARFRREAKALAQLSHPGIVRAFDSGEDTGRHFLVMEFVEGASLGEVLKEKGRLPPARAADYAHQAARALQHAHEKGLVHRDLKPSNLLVTPDGRVKVLDLGLARFLQDQIADPARTREGVGMGTPDYAAPEQFRDARNVDARADIYSLGCTLYHLIAGRVPFPGSSFAEKYEAHAGKEPAPLEELCPEVPGGLALAVRKLMAKHPAARFQTAAEAGEALAPFVAGSSASFQSFRNTARWHAGQLTTKERLSPRRLPWAVAGLLAAALALMFLGFVTPGWFRPGAENPDNGEVVQGNDNGKKPDDNGSDAKKAPAVPDDPAVLTVSQKPEDGGQYRTINDALKDAKPWATIRVLDDAVYTEAVLINDQSRHEGLMIESPRRATLEFPADRKLGLTILNVPRVTVRGLAFRAPAAGTTCLGVAGHCPGVVLKDLEFSAKTPIRTTGVTLDGLSPALGDAPVVVRRCKFLGLGIGAEVIGMNLSTQRPRVCRGLLIRDNVFGNCLVGVWAVGRLENITFVGNRIKNCSETCLRLANLPEAAGPVLIANNSLSSPGRCVEITNSPEGFGELEIRNNLIVSGQGPDVVWSERGTSTPAAWRLDHNWRQVRRPPPNSPEAAQWLDSSEDVIADRLTGVSPHPVHPDFLRPDPGSPLASGGAGQVEPSLPRYVGALPPEGVQEWDWDRTWLAPPGTSELLTVSKDSTHQAKYGTINDALKDAKPWATIRVLDAATYQEELKIDDPKQQQGVRLEAVKGATILLAPQSSHAIAIRGVPEVQLLGFRFLATRGSTVNERYFIRVTGPSQGVTLADLSFEAQVPVVAVGIQSATGTVARPIVVRRCSIRYSKAANDGIRVFSAARIGAARHVRVEGNDIRGALRGIWLAGSLQHIQVVGNVLARCDQAVLQVENPQAGTREILLANNTVTRSDIGLRIWEDPGKTEWRAGQVEVRNNLFHSCSQVDVIHLRGTGTGRPVVGDQKKLLQLWRFGYNQRDLYASRAAEGMPLVETDLTVDPLPVVEKDDLQSADFLRPLKDSPLATAGAGQIEPSLPAYVGALPPEGVEPWDWDRTWRSRMKGTLANEGEEKKP